METTKKYLKELLYSGEFVMIHKRGAKEMSDVLNAATRFYDRWDKKGYGVDAIGLLDGALQSWCISKESKWEHAYQTLYQHLTENRVCYIKKYDFD